LTSTSPALRGGAAATGFENLNYPGNGKYTPGVSLSFPVSKTGMLNFSGFITKGSTSTTAAQALTLFGTSYASGDLVTANYTVRNLKLSLQDLFFPFPRKEGQRWRVKTLWEVQYASIITNLNAPLAPTTDSSGNAVVNTANGTRSIVYPTFGLAGEYHFTRNLVFQANGSGFTVPHHAAIGDAEGSLGYRFGAVELVVGDRYFHFKTSTKNAEYFKTTLTGAYAGLRFYPSMISVPCPFCRKTTASTTADTSSAPANENTVSTPRRDNAGPTTYVHRVSGGATLSVLGLNLVPSAKSTVNTTSTVTTDYNTTGASSRIGYGVTAQVAVTDHFAVSAEGLLRRMGYQFMTTVTTSKQSVVNGVVTTTTTSTNTHEDTRARLIDVPAVVRYYNRGRHEPGTRWFVEGGSAWRRADSIRTSVSSTDASGNLSCCTDTPAQPAHGSVFGVVGGAGVLLIDAVGIRIVPEVQYTRWMNPIFQAFTTNTQRNQVAAGFSITF